MNAETLAARSRSVPTVGTAAVMPTQQEFGAREIIEFSEVEFDRGGKFDTGNHTFSAENGGST